MVPSVCCIEKERKRGGREGEIDSLLGRYNITGGFTASITKKIIKQSEPWGQ
jgi:hypothetical protein